MIEETFGWAKAISDLRRLHFIGLAKAKVRMLLSLATSYTRSGESVHMVWCIHQKQMLFTGTGRIKEST
uniref:Transposase DDE domain-containing protein n=1 Tax=Candidatus Kentrum sp. LFY TaxID=2126342 RepID=A0A450WNE4_9GAMM|nr:MAG: hypothetical protein BECKLFY1418C_GA0070996_10452 [Candidatus Kentron sp. LFY]